MTLTLWETSGGELIESSSQLVECATCPCGGTTYSCDSPPASVTVTLPDAYTYSGVCDGATDPPTVRNICPCIAGTYTLDWNATFGWFEYDFAGGQCDDSGEGGCKFTKIVCQVICNIDGTFEVDIGVFGTGNCGATWLAGSLASLTSGTPVSIPTGGGADPFCGDVPDICVPTADATFQF